MSELYIGQIKKIQCYTPEQQAQYEALTEKQRMYVDYRSAGYQPKEAYVLCGYSEKSASRGAYITEHRNNIAELIAIRQRVRYASGITDKNSEISKDIDKKVQENNALKKQDEAEKTVGFIDEASPEDLERVQFYKDIINGKTISKKTTTVYRADGSVKGKKVEEITDVNAMISARDRLDKIMGINRLQEVGKVLAGSNIVIKIVDAGNTEELSDSRNSVINGEELDGNIEEVSLIKETDEEEGDEDE